MLTFCCRVERMLEKLYIFDDIYKLPAILKNLNERKDKNI